MFVWIDDVLVGCAEERRSEAILEHDLSVQRSGVKAWKGRPWLEVLIDIMSTKYEDHRGKYSMVICTLTGGVADSNFGRVDCLRRSEGVNFCRVQSRNIPHRQSNISSHEFTSDSLY